MENILKNLDGVTLKSLLENPSLLQSHALWHPSASAVAIANIVSNNMDERRYDKHGKANATEGFYMTF